MQIPYNNIRNLLFSEVYMQNFLAIIGHIIGFISMALFFLSYQYSNKKKLLIIQTIATQLSCIQYLLIGAYSGFALNIVCILRNFIYYIRHKNRIKAPLAPVILSIVIAVLSIFSWDGFHSLFITLGLVINTICMGILDSKNLRKTILISSSLILTYNIFAHSYSGIISESLSIISALIGIIRYSKKTSENTTQAEDSIKTNV